MKKTLILVHIFAILGLLASGSSFVGCMEKDNDEESTWFIDYLPNNNYTMSKVYTGKINDILTISSVLFKMNPERYLFEGVDKDERDSFSIPKEVIDEYFASKRVIDWCSDGIKFWFFPLEVIDMSFLSNYTHNKNPFGYCFIHKLKKAKKKPDTIIILEKVKQTNAIDSVVIKKDDGQNCCSCRDEIGKELKYYFDPDELKPETLSINAVEEKDTKMRRVRIWFSRTQAEKVYLQKNNNEQYKKRQQIFERLAGGESGLFLTQERKKKRKEAIKNAKGMVDPKELSLNSKKEKKREKAIKNAKGMVDPKELSLNRKYDMKRLQFMDVREDRILV